MGDRYLPPPRLKKQNLEKRRKYTKYQHQRIEITFKKLFFYPEYSRGIYKNILRWFKNKFVSKFSGLLYILSAVVALKYVSYMETETNFN